MSNPDTVESLKNEYHKYKQQICKYRDSFISRMENRIAEYEAEIIECDVEDDDDYFGGYIIYYLTDGKRIRCSYYLTQMSIDDVPRDKPYWDAIMKQFNHYPLGNKVTLRFRATPDGLGFCVPGLDDRWASYEEIK